MSLFIEPNGVLQHTHAPRQRHHDGLLPKVRRSNQKANETGRCSPWLCKLSYGKQPYDFLMKFSTPQCIAECGLNATGLYSNGMIKRDDMTKMFMDSVKDMPEWQMLVRDTLDECFKMAESKMDEIQAGAMLEPSFEGEKICHPISGTILRCMGMNLFVKCPAGVYNESDECNQLKEYSKMCPIM